MKRFPFLLLPLLSFFLTAACGTEGGPPMREDVAKRLASPAWMVERQIEADLFSLTAYERIHQGFAPADIYIEGDGLAWLSKTRKSLDPTPKNPVALHLATRDKAENVIYLARPCQYTKLNDPTTPCDDSYWTGKRFAPEVLAAYNKALDDIRDRYDIRGFNLIGFSGGGTVAALLAAERNDVLTLRTVAGNLDHHAHSAYHGVSVMNESLNPPDYAERLRAIPQIHFIGGQDKIVPPVILHSYLQALGPTSCAQYEMIQEAAHEEGWVEKWPELLTHAPLCKTPPSEEPVAWDIQEPRAPVYAPPVELEKP
ncbi:MAG: alpha/beta hydrolase [Alphaproteobacteria bacterium]|nr:alpha/beta hydrolase [Alphaproteobacteria bacterium]